MNRPNRGGRRMTPRGIRGSFDWECAQVFGEGFPATGVGANWIVLPSTVRFEYTDPTLFATRIFFAARTDAAPLAGGSFIGFGVIAWDAIDDTVPTQIPRPITDCNLDWVTRAVAPVPLGTPAGTVFTLTFDFTHLSSARRRLGAERGILGVIETDNVAASISTDTRCLLRET